MQAGDAAGSSGSAPFPGPRWRRGAMVGHRLTSGYIIAHGPDEACVLCGERAEPDATEGPAATSNNQS